MVANDTQHGGDHYKKLKYQHWDFVCDTKLHYLLGCASKYIARWRDKGGVLDLEKSMHYLEKAMERGVEAPPPNLSAPYVGRFIKPLGMIERSAITHLMAGNYEEAIGDVDFLVQGIKAECPEQSRQ